jgi:hypothetical protein
VKVGIALPTAIPGVERRQVLDWARRADAAGFSTPDYAAAIVAVTPRARPPSASGSTIFARLASTKS